MNRLRELTEEEARHWEAWKRGEEREPEWSVAEFQSFLSEGEAIFESREELERVLESDGIGRAFFLHRWIFEHSMPLAYPVLCRQEVLSICERYLNTLETHRDFYFKHGFSPAPVFLGAESGVTPAREGETSIHHAAPHLFDGLDHCLPVEHLSCKLTEDGCVVESSFPPGDIDTSLGWRIDEYRKKVFPLQVECLKRAVSALTRGEFANLEEETLSQFVNSLCEDEVETFKRYGKTWTARKGVSCIYYRGSIGTQVTAYTQPFSWLTDVLRVVMGSLRFGVLDGIHEGMKGYYSEAVSSRLLVGGFNLRGKTSLCYFSGREVPGFLQAVETTAARIEEKEREWFNWHETLEGEFSRRLELDVRCNLPVRRRFLRQLEHLHGLAEEGVPIVVGAGSFDRKKEVERIIFDYQRENGDAIPAKKAEEILKHDRKTILKLVEQKILSTDRNGKYSAAECFRYRFDRDQSTGQRKELPAPSRPESEPVKPTPKVKPSRNKPIRQL